MKLGLLIALVLIAPLAHAQRPEPALSDAEVEKLRDTAYFPADRVMAFVEFLDQRTKEIDKLTTGKRQPGREQDIHDLMEQFASIADDLSDNLDEYGQHHRDIRKALPKVIAAAERWGTILRTPPDNEAYTVTRKIALESLTDIRDAAKQLVEEQKTWFHDHPPGKEDDVKPRPKS